MATPAKISQEPTFPRYLRASPDSCSGVEVRSATSATYSMDTVVRTPAMIRAVTRVGMPPSREPYGKLRIPAPMFAPKMMATPCQNVIASGFSPWKPLAAGDCVAGSADMFAFLVGTAGQVVMPRGLCSLDTRAPVTAATSSRWEEAGRRQPSPYRTDRAPGSPRGGGRDRLVEQFAPGLQAELAQHMLDVGFHRRDLDV